MRARGRHAPNELARGRAQQWQPGGAIPMLRPRPWLLALTGLLALLWVVLRVGPKPTRAAYPCQRVAMPLAGGFLAWLCAGVGTAVLARKVHTLLRCARTEHFVGVLALVGLSALIAIVHTPARSASALPRTPPNAPIGVPQGLHAGRVVWVHDPNATDWAGTNWNGEDIGNGYWWQNDNTPQAVVDSMISRAIRGLAGEPTDVAAWMALLRQFNQRRGRGDVTYQPGEKILIKVNLSTANHALQDVDAQGNQTRWLGWVDTSPQVIVALLRQLVEVVGVPPADITVGDPSAYFPNHYWDHCHAEFPDVNYLAWSSELGRRGVVSSQGGPTETPVTWSTPDAAGTQRDYLPVSYAEATYLINLACLKGHSAGVTLCGKNHYGSLIRLPTDAGFYNLHLSLPNAEWSPGLGHYRAAVDLIGHDDLGGKTLLHMIDGLYGGYWWEGRPTPWLMPPFGDGSAGDWPSSLFVSQDPIAVDSVAYDFLLAEWPDVVTGGTGAPGDLQGGAEDYLHEAALADNPRSGTFYDPDGAGSGVASLGVHEHWNNATDKQYTRNLGMAGGIELLRIDGRHNGDFDGDGNISANDFHALPDCLAGPSQTPNPGDPTSPADCLRTFDFDFDDDVDLRDFSAFQLLDG